MVKPRTAKKSKGVPKVSKAKTAERLAKRLLKGMRAHAAARTEEE